MVVVVIPTTIRTAAARSGNSLLTSHRAGTAEDCDAIVELGVAAPGLCAPISPSPRTLRSLVIRPQYVPIPPPEPRSLVVSEQAAQAMKDDGVHADTLVIPAEG
jgi:hypothetical protein